MFGFLFKRSSKAASSVPETQKKQVRDQASDEASTLAAEKAAAVAKAQTFADDEAAAIQFVAQSRFADARFQAAQHVCSKEGLETIAQAMRQTDRRVAKLAQQRLDEIRQKEIAEREALACMERMQSLVDEPVILPNQLAEIERSWSGLANISPDLEGRFEQGRTRLQQRLLQQTALQRSLIELRDAAQALVSSFEEMPPSSLTQASSTQLDALYEKSTGYRASPEAASLPKSLLSDMDEVLERGRRLLKELAQRQMALSAHEQVYGAWEADPDAIPDLETLRRELRSLPALAAQDAHLFGQRLENLQARIKKPEPSPATEPVKLDMSSYRRTLEALEHALDEGALQSASEHEKELRAAEGLALKWKSDEAARLTRARAELSRLQGWARWGGKISREELIKTAEELTAKEKNPSELAKKIGSLRAQWKSMDGTSGAADREAWLRFDAACTAAYVPVAAHFNALAVQRKENAEKAEALIAQVRDFAGSETKALDENTADWKKIASFRTRMVQAWHGIGPVDRKNKKALDKQFAEAMDALFGPLAAAQQEEIKRREQLIEQATELGRSDKKSMAALRALQQQWQQRAQFLPLERKDEQFLWRRFRAACDACFARRQADLQQLDAQHTENLRFKSTLCEQLEAAARDNSGQDLEKLLREVERHWHGAGSVARTDEQALNDRYRNAAVGVRSRLRDEMRAARRKELGQLHKKLALCMDSEEALCAESPINGSDLEEMWRRCDPLPEAFEETLLERFQKALAALQSGDAGYAAILRKNRDELERDLLRLEISLEIASPPEQATERLKLQVEALQASLRSGSPASDRTALLHRLCELPALHDSESRERLQRAFDRFGATDD